MGRRRAAFTLLEMLAVLVIIGLIAGIVIPNVGLTGAQALDDHARRLAADLEFARQRTVMTGIPHRLLLDLDTGSWQVEWLREDEEPAPEAGAAGAPATGRQGLDLAPPARARGAFEPLPSAVGRAERLDEGIVFAGVGTPDGVISEDQVAVTFERDGTAEPAEIVLRGAGGAGVVLEVRPLADAVRIRDEG